MAETVRHLALAALSTLLVAGCDSTGMPVGKANDTATTETNLQTGPRPVRAATTDAEAPDVFSATDQGLWDGRPSLGGVWVATPDAKDPERVMIRNPANGKSVVGALFRRERENPGPRLQVSSDAAAALGMLAGAPAELTVVALRREDKSLPAPAVQPESEPAAPQPTGNAIANKPEDPEPSAAAQAAPTSAAAAAPDKPRPFWRRRDTVPDPGPDAAVAAAQPKRAAPATASPAGGALIQIGIFSVEVNARQTAAKLTTAGVPAEARREESKGKTYWRVVAGPTSPADRDDVMAKVKSLGLKDAYFVSR